MRKEWRWSFSGQSGAAEAVESAAVSVIIPCYRAAATISRALASVAIQSRKPHEVIIVDDASDDNTVNVLHELIEKYNSDWLKVYFLSENRGPAAARNYGWERAGQPYIAFLDADDSWHREKISLQFEFMWSYSEIAFSGHRCGAPADLVLRLPKQFQVFFLQLKPLLFRNWMQMTTTVMLKRDLVLRFPEGKYFSEDYYLWLALLATGAQAAFMDLPLAAIHKPAYGAAGQSAALWRMEQGELSALFAAWRRGGVSLALFGGAVSWSLLKFIRRFFVGKTMNWRVFGG